MAPKQFRWWHGVALSAGVLAATAGMKLLLEKLRRPCYGPAHRHRSAEDVSRRTRVPPVPESGLPLALAATQADGGPESTQLTLPGLVTTAERSMTVIHGVRAAIELDIAEYLAAGPLDIHDLANRANADTASLFRLLRALETVGVFKQVSARRFANTPDSELLRRDVPGSLWVRARAAFDCGLFEAYLGLPQSIRTGRNAFEHVHACNLWEFLNRDPVRASLFDRYMGGEHENITPAVTAAFDWSKFRLIADIGGGLGAQLVDILEASPDSTGVLFDQPDVVARAAPHKRMECAAGSFFVNPPANADAYILRSVIHDWSDAEALTILKNLHAAAKPDSRLCLVERIIPETFEFAPSKWADLNMLALTGGQERTAAEYRELLENAGFDIEQIIPTSVGLSLIVSRLCVPI
jgi:hypothetical protein